MTDPLLVFDLGNVLVDVDFERWVAGAVAAGLAEDVARAAPSTPPKHDLDRGRLSPRAFLGGLAGDADVEALLKSWTAIFTPRPAAARALAELRAAGRELWMLSDTDPAHFARVLDDHPWLRGFDRYLLSFERGRVKADPGAFDELAAVVAAGRPVVFWDDRADLVAAARAAGVDARLFTTWDTWEL